MKSACTQAIGRGTKIHAVTSNAMDLDLLSRASNCLVFTNTDSEDTLLERSDIFPHENQSSYFRIRNGQFADLIQESDG